MYTVSRVTVLAMLAVDSLVVLSFVDISLLYFALVVQKCSLASKLLAEIMLMKIKVAR